MLKVSSAVRARFHKNLYRYPPLSCAILVKINLDCTKSTCLCAYAQANFSDVSSGSPSQ